MRQLRWCVVVALLSFCLSAFAQKQDWLPITAQDWQVKEVPGDPGASAIQLYYAQHIDDSMTMRFVYHRIKVLSEKALQPQGAADVEILIPPDRSVRDLKARTLHPDGTIVEFAGKPFEKVVVKGRGFKYLAKTFTFPEVTVGSILEYKYVLDAPNRFSIVSDWAVQHDLYTVKESLTMTPYLEGGGGYQVSVVSSNLPKDVKLEKKGRGWEMNAQNVPAFQSESYMPPENNYKPEVRLFYIRYQPDSDDKYWSELGKTLYEESERFIGHRGEVKEAALVAIGEETSPEGKLRKLYARAQQLRNLSFERERTEEEMKKESLKDNENTADVLGRGYGWHNQINRLFVGMARAAGFDASILGAGDRKEAFFAKSLLSRGQVDNEIAVIKLNGNDLYLDPGTKFCPFGLLPWEQTSTQALKLDRKAGELVVVPPATQDKAVVRRMATLALDASGTATGEVIVQYKGSEALERRLTALKTDDAGKKKMLEDELKGWLAAGATVKIVGAEGWEGSDEPLTARFSVEVPGYAASVGKRLLMPSYMFQTKQISTFKQSQRKFPVYFPYAFSEVDNVVISIPTGYAPESVPKDQDTRLPYARYQLHSELADSRLVTKRSLLLNGIYFPLERYSELRGFFNKVQDGDEQQAVLQGSGVNAQKSSN